MRTRGPLLLVACALVTGVLVPRASASTADKEASAEAKLFALINQHRADDHMLPALTDRAILDEQSKIHSRYMAKHHKLNHNGFCDNMDAYGNCGRPDGDPTNSRFDIIQSSDSGIRNVCENVAYVYGPKYASPDKAAAKIFKLWDESQEHHDCMFSIDFADASLGGLGVKKKGAYWWATFEAANDHT